MTAPDRVPVAPRPPYATFIPERGRDFKTQFKTHNGVGQAKNAVLSMRNYRHDGFLCDMVIYRLDGDEKEYLPWLKIAQGSNREDYPELTPRPVPRRQREYQAKFAAEAARRAQEDADKAAVKAMELRRQLEEGS